MEFLDTYAATGDIVRRNIPKSTVSDKEWLLAVHLWIFNSQRQFLLQRRSAAKKTSPLKWHVSAAGHVLSEESAIEAITRETEEEIGYVIDPGTLKYVGRFPHALHQCHIKTFLTVQDIDVDTLSMRPQEVCEVRWVSLAELQRWSNEQPEEFVIRPDELHMILEYRDQ